MYVPTSLTRTILYPSQLTVHTRETVRVGSDTICNTLATPDLAVVTPGSILGL
jgi:hypothetical protein